MVLYLMIGIAYWNIHFFKNNTIQ